MVSFHAVRQAELPSCDTRLCNVASGGRSCCGNRSLHYSSDFDLQHRSHAGRAGPQTVRSQAAGRQPARVPGRSGIPGGVADARPPLQVLPGVRGDEASLGAGARRTDRRGDCAGGTAAAHWREVGGLQTGVRQLHRPRHVHREGRAKGRSEAGAIAGHAGADSSRSVPGHHQAGGIRRFRSPPTSARWRITKGRLTYEAFGLEEKQLEVTRISPHPTEAGQVVDMVGIVTTLEGEPLPAGDIASRLGGFSDIEALETATGLESDERRAADRDHSGQPERPAQRLSGFSEVPGSGRQDRTAARSVAVRRVQPQSVPGARGRSAHAGRRAGPGRGDQGVRRSADAGYVGRGLQVRKPGAARPSRHLAGAAANGQISDQSALLSGGHRADVHHHAELGGCRVAGAQPRRATEPDRSQEQRRLPVRHRPAGADSHSGHAGAVRHFDGGQRAEPRERSAAGGGGQPFPQQAAKHARGAASSPAARRSSKGAFEYVKTSWRNIAWRLAVCTSRRWCCRSNWWRY